MISGFLPVEHETDLSRLSAHLAESLRSVSATAVQIDGDTVSFRGGIFRLVDNWNVLVGFGNGVLNVDRVKRTVAYQLSVRQLLLFSGAFAAVIAIALLASGRLQEALLIPLFMWSWLAGGNLLIGIPRFRSFLRKTLDAAPVNHVT